MVRTSEKPKRTDPSKVGVGEIDTRAPFQSVKDAVSLFGEVAFSGEKTTIKKGSPLSAEKYLAKDTRLQLAQKDLSKIKEQLQNAEKTKAEALIELEMAKRTVEQLSHKLKVLTESKEAAIQATEAAQRQMKLIEEANSGYIAVADGCKENSESGTEEYANILLELNAAKQDLANIRHDRDSFLLAKSIANEQVAEAEISAKLNTEQASELLKEISALKETIKHERQALAEAQQEKVKIFSEKDIERQSYKAHLEEFAKKLQMMKEECNPEVTKNLEARLAKTKSEIETLRKEVESTKKSDIDSVKTVTSELDSAKESLQKLLEEENSLQSLVNSLKQELENLRKEHAELKEKEAEADSFAGTLNVELQKHKSELEASLAEEDKANRAADDMIQTLNQLALEAKNARLESAEMTIKAEELRKEAEATRISLEEAEQQLKVVLKDAEEAKAADARAVEQIKALSEQTDAARSSFSESDSKITISRDEFEALSRKAEESEKLAEMKVSAAIAQADAVKASENEALKKIEAAQKEIEETKAAIDEALKKAAMAEAAKRAVEGELRRWREKEQKKAAEAASRIIAKTQAQAHAHAHLKSTRSGPIEYNVQTQDVPEKATGHHKRLDKLRTSVQTKVHLPGISGIFHKKKGQAETGSADEN